MSRKWTAIVQSRARLGTSFRPGNMVPVRIQNFCFCFFSLFIKHTGPLETKDKGRQWFTKKCLLQKDLISCILEIQADSTTCGIPQCLPYASKLCPATYDKSCVKKTHTACTLNRYNIGTSTIMIFHCDFSNPPPVVRQVRGGETGEKRRDS